MLVFDKIYKHMLLQGDDVPLTEQTVTQVRKEGLLFD